MNRGVKIGRGYRHVIVLILWFVYVVNCCDRIAVLTFLPYIQKDLNLSAVEIGWLGSIFFFGYAFAQPCAGYLADRIGAKKTMNVAVWVFSVVTGLTGFVQSFWQFICLRFGLAFGEGQHFAPTMRMISNWFPRQERGTASGFFITSVALAPAIVPVIVTQAAALLFGGKWRPVFFLMALPGFVCIWLIWRYIADSPKAMYAAGKVKKEEYDLITSSHISDSGEEGKTYSSKLFASDIQFYLYTLALFIMLMIYWGMTTWISTFLVRQHGMNLKTMGFYASLPFAVAFFSMFLGGWIADKWFGGRSKIITMISLLGSIPALNLIGFVPSGRTDLLLLGLFIGGFFINLAFGVMYAFPTWRYPKELVGRVVGVSNGVGQFGAFLSPVIAGYLVISLPNNSYDFTNVFIFWSALALVGAVAVFFLEEKSILETEVPEAQAVQVMQA